jgi:hypothetical protein
MYESCFFFGFLVAYGFLSGCWLVIIAYSMRYKPEASHAILPFQKPKVKPD